MEKQRISSNSKLCKRLLILFIVFFTSTSGLFAQMPTESEINNLRIRSVPGQNLLSNEDIKFEVSVPFYTSSQVILDPPDENDGIIIKKYRYYDDPNKTNGGIIIELWLNFTKKGHYHIKPLNVKLAGLKRQIQFADCDIDFNPLEQQPVVTIEFSDGTVITSDKADLSKPLVQTEVGKKMYFKVSIQYIVQFKSYRWDLPKDSIFTQKKEYGFTEVKVREKDTSGEMIPISDFEWTVLVEGKVKFPEFHMMVTAYNGCNVDFKLPEFIVDVKPASEQSEEKQNSYFDDAFEYSNNDVKVEIKNTVISMADCEKLCELRSKESHSLFGNAKKQRIEFEKQIGLQPDQNEFSLWILYFAFAVCVIFIFLFIFFLRKKNLFKIIFTGALVAFGIIFVIYSCARKSINYAICKGCIIRSIPEEKAESKSELPGGNRVVVKESSGEWSYIELGETGGWCKQDDILLIK